ncbi:hypothetical protein BSZ35_14870 [Salinibacter sp. 10B]|uniref:DUF3177 family protein n=1 Tax=Salinibacter sp. 10B TaxID=1923971 RepID=UPI000CF4B7B0|nr:DUF3177 family protein [Salinibacter sp. 10B]PQJ35704.1 hypothetical protein BSZ35_14870 [Salinibacter sp. 10B]
MNLYDTLVYVDFILAVVLLVVVPLCLLGVSVTLPSVRKRLLVYWRTSALLGITVYLWIGETPMGFATGFAARALIPLALWRGDALTVLRDQPIPTSPDWRATVFRYWRAAAIPYNLVGLAYMLPLLPCVWSDVTPVCQAWYLPPQQYAAWLHPSIEPIWLARYGWVALGVYSAYLLATAVRLQRDLLERQAPNS